ncbi:hypothetical protein MASR1M45_04790 [Candidatus Kapaibacterium sp.]
MKTISLKIDDNNFSEIEKILSSLKKPRNRYINEAIEYYNKFQKRNLLQRKLEFESRLTKSQSIEILKEFEAIEYEN